MMKNNDFDEKQFNNLKLAHLGLMSSGETRETSSDATEEISSVSAEDMSSVSTEDRSAFLH